MSGIHLLCHCCKGTGEVIEEPGGDGYAPLYEECGECKGEGFVLYNPDEEYSDDKMYYMA